MKIAIISDQIQQKSAMELATRFVREGYTAAVYAERSDWAPLFNGVRFFAHAPILSLLHAAFVYRANVIHLAGAKHLKRLARILRPGATILTSDLLLGISPRRVSTDDVVLAPLGLRSGSFVAVQAGKGAESISDKWKNHDVKLAVLSDETLSPTTRKAIFAGARFVILSEEAVLSDALEAMSYGRAVLVPRSFSGLPFVKDVIVEYAADNVHDMVNELIADPMQSASIGHAAREYVESEFHWDTVAAQMIEVYENLCYSASVWTKKKQRAS